MKYAYFPGCSVKSSGRAFEESFLAICRALDVGMDEIENWNCCGATMYMSVDEAYAYGLSIRNLALAERTGCDVVAPCGGCYGILLKADHYYKQYPSIRESLDKALEAVDLTYKGGAKVRHPIEILVRDVGTKAVTQYVKQKGKPLKGLKVVSYYGCRLVRPIAHFDDPHSPMTMDQLMKSVGATAVDWGMKVKCCGGSLTGTMPGVGLEMSYHIIRDARRRGADVIVTACPLCQFNLECYQDKMSARWADHQPMPVLYFTQLLAFSMGLGPEATAFGRQIVMVEPVLKERGLLKEAPMEKVATKV
jgi:heterodisulfide reductase subunit B